MSKGRDDFPNAPHLTREYDRARVEKTPEKAPQREADIHPRHRNHTPGMDLKPKGSMLVQANEVDKAELNKNQMEKQARKEAFNKQYGLDAHRQKGIDKDKSKDR